MTGFTRLIILGLALTAFAHPADAMTWARAAALGRAVMSQHNTGAFLQLQDAATQGDPAARTILGIVYESGQGVPQNLPLALHWYQLAAHQGYARAQDSLGFMYYKGKGVTQNLPLAVHWYQRAAQQGFEPAIESLRALQQQMRRTTHAQPVQTPAAAPAPTVAQRASAAPPVHDRQQSLRNLQRFWTLYFQAAHAHLVDFGAPALVQPVGFSAAHP